MEIKNILNKYRVNIYKITNKFNNFSILNQHIENIYVINLKNNILRRNYIIRLMKKFKINFHLVIVDKIEDNIYSCLNNECTKEEIGCTLSHLWCLNNLITSKSKNGIIFEDDIIFHKNFDNLFINTFKKEHDFLLLGACDFSFSTLHKDNVKNGLYTIHPEAKKVYGAHANYYSLNGAKKMFDIKVNNLSFFDKDYFLMFQYFKESAFICYPNLVVTDISTTNLSHTYNFFSLSEINYYNKCFVNFSFTDYHFIYLDILKNKNTKINEKETYKSYIEKILYSYFYNKEHSEEIAKRLDLSLFNIEDLKCMIQGI
jgi:GR25 family glycosyltransferase involved in LPS biosynthesis